MMNKVDYGQYALEHINGCADDCFEPLVRATSVALKSDRYVFEVTIDDQPDRFVFGCFQGAEIDPYGDMSDDYLESMIMALGDDIVSMYSDY
jgi:hypothetical protein